MKLMTGDFAMASEVAVASCRSDQQVPQTSEDTIPQDARLYLRHVEKGESIRSLARELGCHASTILRRIRRFEARRDDPLVDNALTRAGAAGGLASGPQGEAAQQAEMLRVLRRLAEPGAVMATADGMEKAIVTRDDVRIAVLDRHLAEAMALRGWVAQTGQASARIRRYAIVPAGRNALRDMVNARRQGGPLPGPAILPVPVRWMMRCPAIRARTMPSSIASGISASFRTPRMAAAGARASISATAPCICWPSAGMPRASPF